MIYTDGVHLMIHCTEPLDDLHAFAKKIGLKREWFQMHDKHPHYDLTTRRMFLKAIDAGANVQETRYLITNCCNRDGIDSDGNDIKYEPQAGDPDAR
jgi:hypothetical protein